MAEDVGGFWASLKLIPDTASFQSGERALSGLVNGLKSIAGALLTYKLADELVKLAQAQAQLNITASFAGLSTDALAEWGIMLRTANVDSAAFTSSLTALNNQFIRLQTQGEALPEGTAKSIGLLGLDLTQIMGEDSASRASDIIAAATSYAAKTKDTAAAAQLVKNLLGDAGAQYFTWLQLSGKTLGGQADLARSLMYTNAGDRRAVMDPMADLNSLRASFGSMASEFATKFMIHLDPAFKNLLDYLADPKNKQAILNTIDSWATALGKLTSGLGNAAIALGSLTGAIGPMLRGDKQGITAAAENTFNAVVRLLPQRWQDWFNDDPTPAERQSRVRGGALAAAAVHQRVMIGLTPKAELLLTATPDVISEALNDARVMSLGAAP